MKIPNAGQGPSEASGRNYRGLGQVFLLVVGSAIGLLAVLLLLDVSLLNTSWTNVRSAASGAGLSAAMGGLAEVLAAVLGLSLTVVAIVVQLAAARYPAKIVDLFMYDPVNVLTFAFMAASCIYVSLVPVLTSGESAPVLIPAVALALVVLNFGILLPYFGHVFAFLEPTNIISQIASNIRGALKTATGPTSEAELVDLQKHVSMGLDRIADNCMAAVEQSDRNLALHSVKTLQGIIHEYLEVKGGLPKRWSSVGDGFFGTLSEEFVAEIVLHGTWVEAKTFMEFERLMRRALMHMNEVTTQLAAATRKMGEKALAEGELEVLELTIRFFNTYIRHALNAKNVRAVYNILYEYRQFAVGVLGGDKARASRIVEHLVYYGRTANMVGLPFVTVTAAHDVRVLCQEAYRHEGYDMKPILELFLTLDQRPEGKSEAVALMGVRKAQSILGAFFLKQGADDLVAMIREDMAEERPRRLREIRDGILAVTERKFWEVTDRGFNFDYVEPELRDYVTKFFDPMLTASAAE